MPKVGPCLVVLVAAIALVLSAGCDGEPSEPRVVSPEDGDSEPATRTAGPEPTPLADISISLEPLATDLDQPLFVTGAGDGSGRLFVVEKSGRIWAYRNGSRTGTPFLDISDRVSQGSEQGLLGLAFPPDFRDSQTCIVSYTDEGGDSVISQFSVDGDAIDIGSEEVLFTQEQPYANHNGGMVVFGPDGYLYFGLGDGGSGGDPQGNAQNPDSYLGKMLRMDLAQGVPELWALGLRNPWRFSFDRQTGDLWIGDVGQNAWEEIDFAPADAGAGLNYGWNLYEGTHSYPGGEAVATGDVTGYVWPIVEYDRQAGKSVTGGYVYRGSSQEVLWGTYLYADFVDGRIWGLQRSQNGAAETRLLLDNEMLISSFGEDDQGELYLTDLNGGVYRVVAE